MTTTLYRFFDAGGQLLYVGIAGNPGRRFGQHAKDKTWWTQVASSSMQHFNQRVEAERAERAAIRSEGPLHNVVHNVAPSVTTELPAGPPPRARATVTHCGITLSFYETSNAAVFSFTIDGVFSGDWFTHSRFACRADEAMATTRPWQFIDQVTNTSGFVLAEDCHHLVRDFYRGAGSYTENQRGDDISMGPPPPCDPATQAIVAHLAGAS